MKAAFTEAILIRPAVMFGPDDAFLTTMLALLRRLPIYPMFGHGRTRLQPGPISGGGPHYGRKSYHPFVKRMQLIDAVARVALLDGWA